MDGTSGGDGSATGVAGARGDPSGLIMKENYNKLAAGTKY